MKKTLKILYLICISTYLNLGITYGQGCIEYAEIEGNTCGSCVPNGWMATSSSPDILDPTGFICGIGESPSGGNAVHLFSNGSNDIEGIITEVVIDNFIPGNQYYFSVYTAQCGMATSDIEMTIDGEDYVIDPTDDWEILELCLTPTSSTFDLFFTLSPHSGGQVSNTLIDSGICDPGFCCQLLTEIEEGPIELCPEEAHLIETDYFEEVGSATVTWTSEPSEGVDFLDDPNDINPTFNMPFQTDFEGETYVFTYEVEDDECIIRKTIEIEVGPSIVPEFDIFLCEVFEDQELPPTSIDPFTGTWEGNFDFENLGGTVQEYIFTIDPGQDNCLTEWTYEFPIALEEIVLFEFETEYCVTDDNRYKFPEESEDRIEGEWDQDRFRPSDFEAGVYIFTFTPYIEEHCSLPYEMEIEIFDAQPSNFDFPTSYCITADSLFLPTISADGVQGNWDVDFIDLNNTGNFTATFTPEDVFDCYSEYTTTINVVGNLNNTFDIPNSLCQNEGLIVFDSLSLEGNLGVWNPLAVDLDTISTAAVTAQWSALDNGGCQGDVSVEIQIDNIILPEFDIPEELCSNFGIYILPAQSLNGIDGTWSLAELNTTEVMQPTVDLSFTPILNICSNSVNFSINIIDNVIPQFSFAQEYCSGENSFMLPSVSDNGIAGSWSESLIDPANLSNGLTSIFTPESGTNLCAEMVEFNFNLASSIEPTFNLPEYFCIEDQNFVYPISSINGIDGTWSTAEFDPQNFSGTSITNTFTPNNLDCYLPITSIIEVLQFTDVQLTQISPSTCESDDGSITVLNANTDISFSIDDGLTWQSNPEFNTLIPGEYTITIGYNILLPNCTNTYTITLSNPESAVINDLIIQSITNCTDNNGSVLCEGTGNNLEYSIDNGLTWQASPIFENLEAGNYEIIVRADGETLCSDSQLFTIEDFPSTEIIDIESQNPSDCNSMDGSINIDAIGEEIEYSIDDGITWLTNNVFDQLLGGTYNVIVRSQNSNDCFADTIINLEILEIPIIDDVIVGNVSDCSITDGSIEIISSSENVEFSIDGGLSYHSNSVFQDLEQGEYHIVVRVINTQDCIIENNVTITAPDTLEVVDLIVSQPSDCIKQDGKIEIIVSNINSEYSIDQGINWQPSNMFENLVDGPYEVWARNPLAIACIVKKEVEITSPACPCLELIVDYETDIITCANDFSGQIEINIIEGFYTEEDYVLTWEDGTTELILSELNQGWYTYNIEYDKNCSWEDSIYIDKLDPLSFGLLAFDEDCSQLGSIEVVDFEGGSGSYEFSIDNSQFQPSNVFTNLSSQEYEVFVQDILDCEGSENISISANFELSLDFPSVNTINQGASTFLNPLINETTIDSFVWYPSTGILNPGELIAQVSPSESTEYTLTIYFGQCSETRTINVEVEPTINIYIADIFSPNGDSNNDHFMIQGAPNTNTIINSFLIYDRWGNIVYEKIDFQLDQSNEGWDGYFNNQKANIGVYIYTVNYSINEEEKTLVGSLHLIR